MNLINRLGKILMLNPMTCHTLSSEAYQEQTQALNHISRPILVESNTSFQPKKKFKLFLRVLTEMLISKQLWPETSM